MDRITKLATFGAFAEIEPGVEGLIHISELSADRITHPKQVVREGDELQLAQEDVRMTAKTGALPTPTGNEPKVWVCLTDEYVVVSPTLPFKCPRCGASRVKFVVKGATGEGE